MILPTTYAVALLLLILSMICWGSWANTFKLARNWRFELFYFDYAIGVVIAALIAAFIPGESPPDVSTPILLTFFSIANYWLFKERSKLRD